MEQTAQVIFFPVKWFPPFLEIERLDQIQKEMNFTRWRIENECKGDKYKEMLRKQRLANKLKDKVHLVVSNFS